MHTISVLRWLVVVLSVLFLSTCSSGTKTGGFSDHFPPDAHSAFYGAYYRDYTHARLGTLCATLLPSGSMDLHGSSSAYAWDAIVAHVLLPFPSNYCNDTAQVTALLSTTLSKIDPRVVPGDRGIGLVLLFRSETSAMAAASPVSRQQENWLNVSCALAAIEAYNAREPIPRVTAVALTNDPLKYRFTASDTLRLPRELFRVYNFSLLGFSAEDGLHGWEDVVRAAMFNHKRWARGYTFPHHILETRSGLYLTRVLSHKSISPSISEANSKKGTEENHNTPNCLEGSSPSCTPLGGWTVWATNAQTQWEWPQAPRHGFTKHTTPGAAALFIPSTSPTLVHGMAPGANGAASAIVTALGIMDAAGKYARDVVRRNMGKSRDIYVFFFPGEHMGGVGSARFIADAMELDCRSLEDCTRLAYGTALNFTTVNISAMDTFIALDQLAQVDAPLYYHVDARVPSGAAQGEAELQLKDFGLYRAATTQLPYSPITTLLDHTRDMSWVNEKREERVMLTLTRYNTSYMDPFVFTMSDTAERVPRLHSKALTEAANAALRVLYPHETVTANATLIEVLWNCFSAGVACETIFPGDSKDTEGMSRSMDYTFEAFAPITSAQKAIEKALQYIGWNPLRAPAIPRALRIPRKEWFNSAWSLDKKWIHKNNYTRYASVMVESVMNVNRGARGAMISAESLNVMFLLVSCAVGGILVLLTARVCVKF